MYVYVQAKYDILIDENYLHFLAQIQKIVNNVCVGEEHIIVTI